MSMPRATGHLFRRIPGMRSKRIQPAAVPPAAAIRAAVLRRLPPGLFSIFPLAAVVVMVRVVLPVPPDDNATWAVCEPVLPNPALALSVLDEADTTAVPAYEPVEG